MKPAEYRITVDNFLIGTVRLHRGDTQEAQASARREAANEYKIPERYIQIKRTRRDRIAA